MNQIMRILRDTEYIILVFKLETFSDITLSHKASPTSRGDRSFPRIYSHFLLLPSKKVTVVYSFGGDTHSLIAFYIYIVFIHRSAV